MMETIAQKIRVNGTLSNDEVNLLGMSSIPLYKILVVNAASQFGLGAGELDSLAEIVAVEVLLGNIERMLDDVARSQIGFDAPEQKNFDDWRRQVQEVRINLNAKRVEMSGKLSDTYQIIQRTQLLEASLKNTMSPQISASLRFGRGLSAQGIR